MQSQIGQSLATCRAALGDAAFQAAWAAGQALSLEQAIADAEAAVLAALPGVQA